MAKYMILYNSTVSASEQMANASQEEMNASMAEWIKWRDNASQTTEVDFGMPLQAVSRINSDRVSSSDSHASGYSFVEGDSRDAIVDLLKNHPHLKSPGSYIELLEILPMPGM
jgi:hypothetical protein